MVELPRKEMFEPQVAPSGDSGESGDRNSQSQPGPAMGRGGGVSVTKVILSIMLLGAGVYGAFRGFDYLMVGRYFVSTDNAYVQADFTTVAPKVGGYIKDVLVDDNDVVSAGQVLARIDDRDFQAASLQAKADVRAAEAAIANIDAQIELQGSIIGQAKASLEASRASLVFAKSDADRNARLISSGAGTQSRAEQTQSVLEQSAAAVEREEAALVAAMNKLPVLRTQKQQAAAQHERALAALRLAELDLSYTNVLSAVDGTVGARSVRVGQLVSSGMQLMAVVPLHAAYVVANFKETQLTFVRPGQAVRIKVDGFPNLDVHGRVDSISPASGLEFSLLPPDNATGNFTKIVQRIPVKIILEGGAPDGTLRAGMSVVPQIDTRDAQASVGL